MTSKIALVATFKMIADFRNKICRRQTWAQPIRLAKRLFAPGQSDRPASQSGQCLSIRIMPP